MSILDSIRERLSPADILSALRPTKRGVLAGLAYLLYGAAVFAVVFAGKYALRQADDLARKAVARIPDMQIEFSHFEPRLLPPSATLDFVRVRDKSGRLLLDMNDVDVRASVMPLLLGKASASVQSRMYGGLVKLNISTGVLFNTDRVSGDISLAMVELQKIPQVVQYDKTMKGFASLDGAFSGDWRQPESMEIDLYADLDQLDMENRFPIIKGARLKGFRVDLDCSLANGVLTIRDLDLQDNAGIALKSEGTIALAANNFGKSQLAMKGRFVGPPNRVARSVLDPKVVKLLQQKKAVPISILGTVAKPNITLK